MLGISVIVILFTGCNYLKKTLYPTKRSYSFSKVEERLMKDLDERNNKDLVTYFTKQVQKKYGIEEIKKELANAEAELGKIHNFRSKERGKSGHRGGLGETVTAWQITLDTDCGRFYVVINWSSGDISGDDQLERETEGIKNIKIYSEEYNNLEGLKQFGNVDFPVLYPGIKR